MARAARSDSQPVRHLRSAAPKRRSGCRAIRCLSTPLPAGHGSHARRRDRRNHIDWQDEGVVRRHSACCLRSSCSSGRRGDRRRRHLRRMDSCRRRHTAPGTGCDAFPIVRTGRIAPRSDSWGRDGCRDHAHTNGQHSRLPTSAPRLAQQANCHTWPRMRRAGRFAPSTPQDAAGRRGSTRPRSRRQPHPLRAAAFLRPWRLSAAPCGS